ncbi:MAG: leucine-rich repeat domain-containing protein, partial [Prevotella sp.]|nr:leucine-rich repeat domain-containing protein [Prevotella sp.]
MNRVLIFTFLFCISAGLWADNEEQLVYGWTYDAEGNLGVKVTAGNATTGNVVIPATKWDYPVIEIGAAAFKSNNAITSVTLPNSVRVIGDEAFWSCANLQSATLGNSLTSIGNLAFQYCKSLKSISLPNTLASVGDHF